MTDRVIVKYCKAPTMILQSIDMQVTHEEMETVVLASEEAQTNLQVRICILQSKSCVYLC